ncbi:MAG: hypothetical protein HC884_05930 [Chloroflexaceae bacterium]|nr:hypothetical protein [Chloroflexaceae bacterium]
MEASWQADRTLLRQRYHENPHRRIRDFAELLKRSVGWVAKWLKRISAAPHDETVLNGQSRQRHHRRRG